MNSLSCLLSKDDLLKGLQEIEKQNQVSLMIAESDVVMGLKAFERHIYTSWSANQRYDLLYSRANRKGVIKANEKSCYTVYAFANAQEVFIKVSE